MPTPFDSVIAAASATINQVAGVSATYRRGADTGAVTLAPGEDTRQAYVETGADIQGELKDWLIDADKLVLNAAGQVLPAHGDEVVVTIGGRDKVYLVSPPLDGEPIYRWSDNGQTRLRIHTHLKGVS